MQVKAHVIGRADTAKSEQDLLKCDELTSFWLTWRADKVQLGKGVYTNKNIMVNSVPPGNTRPDAVTFRSTDDNSADLFFFTEETDHTNYCSSSEEPTQGLLSGTFNFHSSMRARIQFLPKLS